MVSGNWSWIVVAGCELHYLVLARFGSFRVVANFSTTERFKYLFFTSMKIDAMVRIVKKQKNFIFSSLVTCVSPLLSGMNNCPCTIIWFVLKSSLYDIYMRLCDYQFYLLISPARLFHSAQSFSFKLKRNTIRILCW